MFRLTTPCLIGQAGVPKRKRTMALKQVHTLGIHFKHKWLRYSEWYHCPLCAEPKTVGQYCRREDCRAIKP
jgi:hypothetical protein